MIHPWDPSLIAATEYDFKVVGYDMIDIETDGLPEHEFPSPLKPDLQAQVYPPTVFVQSAFAEHFDAPLLHSSTSITYVLSL